MFSHSKCPAAARAVLLASAGYTARAQDASTVFTNPAGMTRLEGNQLALGAQLLHANLGFSIGQATSPASARNTR